MVKNRKSFTLIELLISVGILSLVLSITGGVLLAVVKSYQKRAVISEVERNGAFVMSYIEERVLKGLTIRCDDAEGLSTCSGSGSGDALYIGGESDSVYIGMKSESVLCDGTTKANNYLFATDNVSNTGDSKKLTNDSANGVNVTGLAFTVDSNSPTRVTVILTVENSKCSSWNVNKTFQSFVTVRSTY